jgi:3-hydroxyisobutyrate dehydrogenase-like beta-hydroxyacid dehydrogenase
VGYLRSPVSGSTAMADAGTLTALVSGPKSAFDQMAPLYESFAKKAFYLGPAEEARYLKLAINSMVAATSALLGEALAVGNQAGMSDAAMLEVITQSAVASPLIGYKKDMIVSGDYRPAATLTMLSKDLGLFLKAAAGAHVATPINTEVHRLFEEASSRGLGEKDFFVLVREAKKGRQV